MITTIVLLFVFLLITIRKIGKINLEMWQIMCLGALANIIFLKIPIKKAFEMIDWHIILFLFFMFSIGSLLELSGYLNELYSKAFKNSSIYKSLYLFIFICAFLSAIIMNDTMAILSVPIISYLSRKHSISTKPFIIAAAFAITIGSALSPIGNPQNFFIAIKSGIKNPFLSFLKHLFIPTVINLLLLYWIIRYKYKEILKQSKDIVLPHIKIKKGYLYSLSKLSMALLIGLIFVKFYLSTINIEFSLLDIAIISSLPSLLLSFKQIEILKRVDWKTLAFFIGMFIVVNCVWEEGYIKGLLSQSNFLSINFILLSSLLLSQFISNVPLVAIFVPIMLNLGAGEKEFISLAVFSTIAGNISILGAASNVIIIQNLESRKIETITPIEFIKIGIPTTIINSFIYYIFLRI